MENLEEIRREIDAIDEQMAGLFERRMEQSRKVAEYKMARGLAVTDSGREAEVIKRNASLVSQGARAFNHAVAAALKAEVEG